MKHRIPQKLKFPGGYTVFIKILDDRTFDNLCRPDALALWDDSQTKAGGIIFLRKSRSVAERWSDLSHELVHVANDLANWLDGTIVQPLKMAELAELTHLAEEQQ